MCACTSLRVQCAAVPGTRYAFRSGEKIFHGTVTSGGGAADGTIRSVGLGMMVAVVSASIGHAETPEAATASTWRSAGPLEPIAECSIGMLPTTYPFFEATAII